MTDPQHLNCGPDDHVNDSPAPTAFTTSIPTVKEAIEPPIPEVRNPTISLKSYQDAAKVLKRCNQIAMYSAVEDGIERVSFSKEHRVVNTLVSTWMRELGMQTHQDAAGNQWGRLEGKHPGLPALVLGSHLDTVPSAGRYDGILGVMLALSVVKRLGPIWHQMPFALEVVGFTDEEGTRFGTALLGSNAVAGTFEDSWWLKSDDRGIKLEDAFVNFGLDPARAELATRRPEQIVAYFEAHIEQRPYLERAGQALGVVTSIASAKRLMIKITGETRHAGTPYDIRKDALLAASRAIPMIMEYAEANTASATVGHIRVSPDAVNVVPGVAEFSLDYRTDYDDVRDAELEHLIGKIRSMCSGLDVEVRQLHEAEAVRCAPALREIVTQSIADTTETDLPLNLFSVAGHDAMAMNSITEVAMLFIRCGGGISHNPRESVTIDDVAQALDAFERMVLLKAAQHGGAKL